MNTPETDEEREKGLSFYKKAVLIREGGQVILEPTEEPTNMAECSEILNSDKPKRKTEVRG